MPGARTGFVVGLLAATIGSGCRSRAIRTVPSPPDSLSFQIHELKSHGQAGSETKSWLGTYVKGGKSARFRIELTLKPGKGDLGLAFSSGAFYPEPRSESGMLLHDLARVLDAKRVPVPATRKRKIPFQVAILGQGLNENLSGDPKGSWLATKVFLGDDEAEFYLNLDPLHGEGRFALKDSEYGNAILKYLCQVL